MNGSSAEADAPVAAAPAGAASAAHPQSRGEHGGCDASAAPGGGINALYAHAPAAAWTLAQWVTLLAVVFGICGAWIAAAVAEYTSPKALPGLSARPGSSTGAEPRTAPPPVRPTRSAGTAWQLLSRGSFNAPDLPAPGFACCGIASPAELLVRTRFACAGWVLFTPPNCACCAPQACANATAPLDGVSSPRVAVVTQITGANSADTPTRCVRALNDCARAQTRFLSMQPQPHW